MFVSTEICWTERQPILTEVFVVLPSKTEDYAKLFFDVEAETEKSICHEEICNSEDREKG